MFDSTSSYDDQADQETSYDGYIIRSWADCKIRQRADGYLSLTDMAQATATRLDNWLVAPRTRSYLAAAGQLPELQGVELVQALEGSNRPLAERGTWGHRRVAIRFAQHCDDHFALVVDGWIEELLTKGFVTIDEHPPTPEAAAVTDSLNLRDPDVCGTIYPNLTPYLSEKSLKLRALDVERGRIEAKFKGKENAYMREQRLAFNDAEQQAIMGYSVEAPVVAPMTYHNADGSTYVRPPVDRDLTKFKTRLEDFERIVGDREVISLAHIMALLQKAGCPTEVTTVKMSAFVRRLGYYPLPDNMGLSKSELNFKPISSDKTRGKLRFHSKVLPKTAANPIEQYLPAVLAACQRMVMGECIVDTDTVAAALNEMSDQFPMVIQQRLVSNTLIRWGWAKFTRKGGVGYARCFVVPEAVRLSNAPDAVMSARSRQFGMTQLMSIDPFLIDDYVVSHQVLSQLKSVHPEAGMRVVANGLIQRGWVQLTCRMNAMTTPYSEQAGALTWYARNPAAVAALGDDGRPWDARLVNAATGVISDGEIRVLDVVTVWQQQPDRPFDLTQRFVSYNLTRLGYRRLRTSRTFGPIFAAK